jgi:hypothetical protein
MKRTILLIALATVSACGPAGPRTHPVSGRVVAADVRALAGGHVEVALLSDPSVRASGQIQPDGTFRLQTNHAGAVLSGALEGRYQVRILPPDDDPKTERRARAALAARFLRFETSKLTLSVPTADSVTLEVSPR